MSLNKATIKEIQAMTDSLERTSPTSETTTVIAELSPEERIKLEQYPTLIPTPANRIGITVC
jgi:hypothetical protein